MNRDENLLFGVFAVQLRKVTPSQIMEAAVEAHGGDATKTLQAFGGEDQVADSFCHSIVVTPDGPVTTVRIGLNLFRRDGQCPAG